MVRHTVIPTLGALIALVSLASCTLDFDRYDPSGAVSTDAGDSAVGTDSAVSPDGALDEAAPVADTGGAESDSAIGADATTMDGATRDGSAADALPADATTDTASDAGPDATGDAGTLATGLVAFYKFDETSGTSAADSSGNGHTATLAGGATFASGLQNNAVSMNGTGQYVTLPGGIVNGLSSFSVSAWVNLTSNPSWSRVFDFGTGTTTYMFLTPNTGTNTRFSVTTGGPPQEQQISATSLPRQMWQHVVVTLAGSVGTLYVNGAQAAQNTNMTLTPGALGSTTQNWLGRSQFNADPYYSGLIDNFRIYSRALSAAEVQALYSGHL